MPAPLLIRTLHADIRDGCYDGATPNRLLQVSVDRHAAQSKLDTDFKNVRTKFKFNQASPGDLPASNISKIAQLAVPDASLDKIGLKPLKPGEFKVGILGAGCAGLFTGLLLDWLHEEIPELKISYNITEAAGPDRFGGRLYTQVY